MATRDDGGSGGQPDRPAQDVVGASMRCLSVVEDGTAYLHREPVTPPGAAEVLIRVLVEAWRSDGDHGTPFPSGLWFSGRVVLCGDEVAWTRPGALVACGASPFEGHRVAEYRVVPEWTCLEVDPETTTPDAAALAVPAGVAATLVQDSAAEMGDPVTVVGAGLLGALLMPHLEEACAWVTVIERDIERRLVAMQLGAAEGYAGVDGDVGIVTFETTGTVDGVTGAVGATRPDGLLVFCAGLVPRWAELVVGGAPPTLHPRTDLRRGLVRGVAMAAKRPDWHVLAKQVLSLEGLLRGDDGVDAGLLTLVDPGARANRPTTFRQRIDGSPEA